MKDAVLQKSLSRLMLYGMLLAAAVLLAGGIVYLAAHGQQPPGDHIFRGEPKDLRDPVAILKDAVAGSDPAIIQLGVFLLLANPFLRVAFATFGFAAGGDRLYAVISFIVLSVLACSFFV